MVRRLLSYLIPMNVASRKSTWSKNLEITWNNGQLVMDSKNTNYSYGSLQRILRKGLQSIGYKEICTMEHILVLGVAGGSVIKTLVDEVKFKGKITGVDIDAQVIAMANEYFKLNEIPNLDIIIDDAFEFVLKTKHKYNLIIIDIFQDTTMPNFLFEAFFSKRLHFLLEDRGILLFNTMLLSAKDNLRNQQYIKEVQPLGFDIQLIPRVEEHNELIIARKG
ncbi:MAG: spermidine synthase [Flavobacterium sp. BFFFF1]|uniref:spermidine synthase n=1 Tax=Flavobacterium sp. BFFFF1 TaxID=2015557 RepID=UPI000BC42A3C|nr:methyltransferase domain-containing protein [Flavobacterium sp. BFFFF1]OYU81765.1 MAG: spermidine synthase [Flavobacterium sp. BFFFF1]